MHQGSGFSPLLFVTVMEAVSLPWELLYADNLVVTADSEQELEWKLNRWKDGYEKKGMNVNISETKTMVGERVVKMQTVKQICKD